MKTFLLFGALALSLAANVWLATSREHPAAASSSPTAAASAATGREPVSAVNTRSARRTNTDAPAANSALVPVAWRQLNSEAELRAMVADLRAAGFPPKAILAVVSAMLREQMQAGFAKLPFWQRLSPGKETVAAQQAAARDMQTKLEQILGPDGRQSVTMDPVLREQRYGTISDDKLEAVFKLERDYQEMKHVADGLDEFSPEEFKVRQARLDLLAKEQSADLASLLSPAELEAYELRNSGVARRIQAGLREIAVSDEEYAMLYRLQKASDAANPRGFDFNTTPEQVAQWQKARLALQEQMRTVLPDDRFYKYLEGTDPAYVSVSRFAEKNSIVTPATTYEVYRLQIEAQATLGNLTRQSRGAGENSPAAVEFASKLAAYNARLNTLLGPEVADAYRKQRMGRIFNPPTKPAPSPGG